VILRSQLAASNCQWTQSVYSDDTEFIYKNTPLTRDVFF